MSEPYESLKETVYPLACMTTNENNDSARRRGFTDIYDMIMSDPAHPRQAQFLMYLPDKLKAEERKTLLDGLAREYRGCEGWLVYKGEDGFIYIGPQETEPVRYYRVDFTCRRVEHMHHHDECYAVVKAYTAQDAVTQVTVSNGHMPDFQVTSVAPWIENKSR